MKFGESFSEYLEEEHDWFLDKKCSYVEYKRLKKVLKSCRACRSLQGSCDIQQDEPNLNRDDRLCQCQSCPMCDQMFFSELMKEASDVAGCFSLRVRHLLHLHSASGMQRYLLRLRQCFINNEVVAQEGKMLIEYISMNAIAIRKILKKYDKVHGSVNGKSFKSMMQTKHIELLQSPWLIELGAFYLNFNKTGVEKFDEFSCHFSCELHMDEPTMTLMLRDSVQLQYGLTCAICLDILFDPYALGCGHLFCKSCVCSAASVLIFQGPKSASLESKCPVCREVGVYAKPVHMHELRLLLKRRWPNYWKERLAAERVEMLKQSKEFWNSQSQLALGY